MAKQSAELSENLIDFIDEQKMFFVGTAAVDGRVNVSPKGMDSLKVLDKNRVIWLNVTGSGNETSAHVQENPRMTLMFCAFEGDPLILRLYGQAAVVHRNDPEWNGLYKKFEPIPGARQIFDLQVEMVQESCGKAVPLLDYVGDRDLLNEWALDRGEEGLREYWHRKNQQSIDGKPTHIVSGNLGVGEEEEQET